MTPSPTGRPTRPPDLLAALEAVVPTRVVKRVRDNPGLALGWEWSADGTSVRVDDVEVRIGLPVGLGTITCTCLLAPRCVHVLAVAAALPEAGPEAEGAAGGAAGGAAEAPPTVEAPPADVTHPIAALTALLALGAASADAVVRAELGRAALQARGAGLHRLGRALTRLVRSLRLLHTGHPTFALDALVEELVEALLVCRQLARSATPEWVGLARRTYTSAGTLRLWGVWSEPVLSGTGVVSWLADARGRLFSVPDVRPRPAGQVRALYDVAPPLSTLSHRQLGREGLFVQGATEAEGRLGAGEGVAAVRAGGAAWTETPLAGLWEGAGGPTRAHNAEEPLFLTGAIVGLWRDALVIEADGPVFVVAGSEHASLPWRDNLRLLGRVPGRVLRLVGRPVPGRRRAVVGLAAAFEGALGGALPPEWAGRVNLGLDRLTTGLLADPLPEPIRVDHDLADAPDPLAALRRRVGRVALGGAGTLPGEAMGEVAREAAFLQARAAPAAAVLLAHLAGSARGPELAWAWLSAARYLAAVDDARRATWTAPYRARS